MNIFWTSYGRPYEGLPYDGRPYDVYGRSYDVYVLMTSTSLEHIKNIKNLVTY